MGEFKENTIFQSSQIKHGLGALPTVYSMCAFLIML